MERIISRAELSRWANVSRAAVTKACAPGAPLYDAASTAGVDVNHPIVREWLGGHGVSELPAPPPAKKPPAKKPPAKKPPAKKPPAKKPPAKKPPAKKPPATADDIGDLEELTVREVVMRYGSVDGFKRFVDSLKGIAEYKHRELRVRQQRGDLIEREKVAGLVFPLIEEAFTRLVSDVPESVSKLVVARAEAGGPDTSADIVRLIRDANSRVLKNLKQTANRLEVLHAD